MYNVYLVRGDVRVFVASFVNQGDAYEYAQDYIEGDYTSFEIEEGTLPE